MNTKKIIVLSGLMLAFLSLSSFKSGLDLNANIANVDLQDGLVVYAVFKSKTEAGYNFTVVTRNSEEKILTFQKMSDAILASYDLNAETYVGVRFLVTFNQGDDGVNVITKLEKK